MFSWYLQYIGLESVWFAKLNPKWWQAVFHWIINCSIPTWRTPIREWKPIINTPPRWFKYTIFHRNYNFGNIFTKVTRLKRSSYCNSNLNPLTMCLHSFASCYKQNLYCVHYWTAKIMRYEWTGVEERKRVYIVRTMSSLRQYDSLNLTLPAF